MKRVPPYFDRLLAAFAAGDFGRHVHLGHWDQPGTATADPDAFARAQVRLCAELLEMAGIEPAQTVLDVGCGFGGTLAMIEAATTRMCLIGVNIDRRQLAICASLRAQGDNRYLWAQGDACALPIADHSVDRLLCIEAMFHFPSRRRFFAEAARVLRPGGVMVASDIVMARGAEPEGIPALCIEAPMQDGYGPWPDFWCDDADHAALAAAAGLSLIERFDASAQTLPSHAFTAPAGGFGQRDPADIMARAGVVMRWLHETGRLRYLYLRCDKPALL